MTLAHLPGLFREKAATLRLEGGADPPAVAWDRAAELVEQALHGHSHEALPMDQAVIESGYTLASLRRLNREGKMPIGDDGTVLRRHLPKKPGHGIAVDLLRAPSSRVQLARTVAGGD